MADDLEGTRLGSGMFGAVRAAAIGMTQPLVPTRELGGEPAVFIPGKWEVSIVRVGQRVVNPPREVPTYTHQTAGGRPVQGRLLHVPRSTSIVLGRDPLPKDDQEKDDRQVCVQLLRAGAAAEKVSSAALSLVRVAKEGRESLFAVSGHYNAGMTRRPPTLFPIVDDGKGNVLKQLNGPRLGQELAPGMQVYFGYLLEGNSEPRTYSDPTERLYYLEGVVELDPRLSLEGLSAATQIGERTICFAVGADRAGRAQVFAPEGEKAVLSKDTLEGTKGDFRALNVDLGALARRISRYRRYDILVGSDLGAMNLAARSDGLKPDYLVIQDEGLQPAHACFLFRPDGEVQASPLSGSAMEITPPHGAARPVSAIETLMDGSVISFGGAFKTKYFNKREPSKAPGGAAPRAESFSSTTGGFTVRQAAVPAPAQRPSSLMSRVRSLFGRR